MKEKALHISAIIPDTLYVKRDADRKLQDVIKRMSKPAYISVARQMGKTNLLIHTKAELEDENNRFVFIDITNQFKSSQDCFRYIIDQVIDANEDIPEFREAGDFIRKARKRITDNPTKEYQDELREILKRYKGNLVIFLDEVDDLRKHNFSDEVFAQIRKTYFLRVTYPVFNRLSYVLSGVIDPEKLIKNKDNSPFNIAIPVYLSDFTRNEMDQLVKNSGMELPEGVKEHLYGWLSGNPRMTFDTLSRIEDEYLDNKELTKELVDSIINDTYLKSFKNPPVDHIRDMVKRNSDLRKSVVKIKEGKAGELSDDEKNKLYLYGIINADFKKESVQVKNRVLEQALSENWLKEVELETRGYYELGREKIDQNSYDEGIVYLKEYIKNSPKGNFVPLANFGIGEAYYFQRKHELSNEYLLPRPITKGVSRKLYFLQLLYIGMNFSSIDKHPEALEIYNEMLADDPDQENRVHAMANKAEVHLIMKDLPNLELISLYKETLVALQELDPVNLEKDIFLTLLNFRLGRLHYSENDIESSIAYFNQALVTARDFEKPIIYLNRDLCVRDDIERRKLWYDELADLIINKQVTFTEEKRNLAFGPPLVWLIIVNLYEFHSVLFEKFLEYTRVELYEGLKSRTAILFEAGSYAFRSNDRKTAASLYHDIINSGDTDIESKMLAYQLLGLMEMAQNPKAAARYLENYIRLFQDYDNFNREIVTSDLTAFIQLISYLRENAVDMDKSFRVAKLIEGTFNYDWSDELKVQMVVILFYIMDYHMYTGNLEGALIYGRRNLDLIQELKPRLTDVTYVNKNVIDQIERQTSKLVNASVNFRNRIEPVRVERERGRNEWVQVRYLDGRVEYGKFKKFKSDIDSGACIVLR